MYQRSSQKQRQPEKMIESTPYQLSRRGDSSDPDRRKLEVHQIHRLRLMFTGLRKYFYSETLLQRILLQLKQTIPELRQSISKLW